MTDIELVIPDHPATFSRAIIEQLRSMLTAEVELRGGVSVLDPFAGVGGVHELAELRVSTLGVELQPEWAAAHADNVCGSVLDLGRTLLVGEFVDCIVTSPCYGNRMADSHDARERCSACDGSGVLRGDFVRRDGSTGDSYACEACDGKGVRDYVRNTYTHALRRSGVEPLASDDNATVMQWGEKYRGFHESAWRSCDRVLRPGGLVLLNVKNHVRGKTVQRVVEFHVNCWLRLGYTIEEARRIETKGLPYGANHDARVPAELIVSLRKPL